VAWPDPETLTHFWPVAIILAIAAVGSAIGKILGWFKRPLQWFRSRAKGKVEQKHISLSFVPNDLHCRWSEGKLNEQSTTTVHGRWHVTNTSNSYVTLLKVRLAKHTAQLSQVSTHHYLGNGREDFGTYPIRSHQMTEVMAVLEFFPAIHHAREPIIIDAIFTDNFANEHRVPTQFFNIQRGPSPQLLGRLDR